MSESNLGDTWETDAGSHQEALDAEGIRKSQGAFYTPIEFASQIAATAIDNWITHNRTSQTLPRLIDPSCGSGNFLLVAARYLAVRLFELGEFPDYESAILSVVSESIYGVDIDSTAILLACENLAKLAGAELNVEKLKSHFWTGDPLFVDFDKLPASDELFAAENFGTSWRDVFPWTYVDEKWVGFDIVLGNPPFINPMASSRPYDPQQLEHIAENLDLPRGSVFTANISALFLTLAFRLVAQSNGVVAMVQPLSVVGANRALELNSLIQESRPFEVWFRLDKAFDAAVETLVVFTNSSRETSCLVTTGSDRREISVRNAATMTNLLSELLADVLGIPQLSSVAFSTVSDIAISTNDFRDQFYGLQGAVQDLQSAPGPRLVTTALIDFAVNHWGKKETSFARTRFKNPVVQIERLDDRMQNWARGRMVPKVIISTQTRIVEAWVDANAHYLPSIPLISSVPIIQSDLWKLGAAIANPVSAVFAYRNFGGSGMSGKVLKLNGAQIGSLPLPTDIAKWTQAAELLKSLHDKDSGNTSILAEFAWIITSAYGVAGDDPVVRWWLERV